MKTMGSPSRFAPLLLAAAFLSGPVRAQQMPNGFDRLVVPGEVLVQLDSGAWARVTCQADLHPMAAAAGWAQVPGVRRAQPNYVYRPHLAPGDPRYGEQTIHQICESEGA